jgi:hypothetical protein
LARPNGLAAQEWARIARFNGKTRLFAVFGPNPSSNFKSANAFSKLEVADLRPAIVFLHLEVAESGSGNAFFNLAVAEIGSANADFGLVIAGPV